MIKWLKDVQTYSNINVNDIVYMLIANKIDKIVNQNEVRNIKGWQIADENNMIYFETSAKTGYNVDKIFIEAGDTLYKKIKNNKLCTKSTSNAIAKGSNVYEIENKNRNTCCI